MISKTMEKALNREVNRELYSSYLYLSMSSYFETVTMKGFAQWMQVQAKEEQIHAMKILRVCRCPRGKGRLPGYRGAEG